MAISDKHFHYVNGYWHHKPHQLLQSNWCLPDAPEPKEAEWEFHCCIPNGRTIAKFYDPLSASIYLEDNKRLVLVTYRNDEKTKERRRNLQREQGKHWLEEDKLT